jgi:hypothetical protein
MSAISNYLENIVLNSVLNNTAYTGPADLYLALFTSSTLLEAGTLTDELTNADYSRKLITFTSSTAGIVENENTISYPTATADWPVFTGIAIMDASTAGNVLFWKATNSKRVRTGQDFFINPGDIKITLD